MYVRSVGGAVPALKGLWSLRQGLRCRERLLRTPNSFVRNEALRTCGRKDYDYTEAATFNPMDLSEY